MVLEAIVIAGANGSGKTTFARRILPTLYPGVAFLNVDEIQAGESAFVHPISAARGLLRRLTELESLRQSFAIETTL